MSIFDSLPSPAERVKTMLLRDLRSRVERDVAGGRWPHPPYAYHGGADLVLRHGFYLPGRWCPEKYDSVRGELGDCFNTHALVAIADPSLTYMEGYCTTGASYPFLHAWCWDGEGVVDLTGITTKAMYAEFIAHDWRDKHTRLPPLPADRNAYMGVTFAAPLLKLHCETLGLGLLDRSGAEHASHPGEPEFEPSHDYPILKVPYDPDRSTLP